MVCGDECLESQFEVAHQAVVAMPHPVGVLIRVVVGPPATTVGILHGQIAHKFSQRGVMGVAAGMAAANS